MLTAGSKLGPYEIIAPLGEGGMGAVYRARDTKLSREVAIKVLLQAVANDADRLARFQREAQVLASLNHPHIAAIYGLEDADGTKALVLELVEGPTLADRIAQGAIPLDEALPIAKQVAEALEAAHEQGIIHRDLKPANIKVRPDGTVKVLDFGLAKAIDPAGASSANAMNSPTLSMHATQAGIILGTAAYMSPEQARGKAVDRRADIWAFGCVLVEMLTGARAFLGDDVTDTIVSVVSKEPDWSALPPAAPPGIRRLLRRCLEKDPKRRLDSAAAVRIEIDEALTGSPAAANPASGATAATPTPAPRRVGAWLLALALVGGVTMVGLGALAGWVARAPAAAESVAFKVDTASSLRADSFAISPDGRQLAFTALDKDGKERLRLRPLASVDARVVAGTEGAVLPFWSPDSRRIAFFTQSELKRIDLAGGAAQTICKTTGNPLGGTWNDQQVILFGHTGSGILRVPASGGEPQTVTTLQAGNRHAWPVFMPDGRHFMYLANAAADVGRLLWRALDTSEEHVVRAMSSKAFVSSTGQLLFRLDGPIVAQPFDAVRGTVSGEPVQVAPDTMQTFTQTALSVSPAGVLAHRAGQASEVAQLSWRDREGNTLTTVGEPADYRNPSLDAAGERVVANTVDSSDVWLLDGRRGTTSRLTFDPAVDSDAIFSPDGRWVAFYSTRQPPGLYRKPSSGAGADELIAATGLLTYPRDWSLDGRFLLYDSGADGSVWALPMEGDRKPFRYPPSQSSGSQVVMGHFSPDAKWVAYASSETGRQEVFVQDFPATGAKFQVSITGGSEPRWRGDGRELYFLAADGRMTAVDVESTPAFRLGVPTPLFQTRLNFLTMPARRYGISSDGKRFLMNVPLGGDALAPITVILNWQAALKK